MVLARAKVGDIQEPVAAGQNRTAIGQGQRQRRDPGGEEVAIDSQWAQAEAIPGHTAVYPGTP